jgi:transglutaminase-like putative cysteine protease
MRYRLTITAAIAVLAASFSLFTVISGAGWLYASAGAVVVTAAAGLATRLGGISSAAAATGLVLVAALPLLSGGNWPERIGGVVLVAAMAGSALTRRALPALADAGTYLAALFLYLNLVFASGLSWAWVIPTARSARHLWRLASAGYAEHIYAPPVPGSRGLELIAAAGVGVIAILTDLVAVRMRSPAVAGLPLLVLFSVPVATNVRNPGVGLTLAFCLGITGYLALLSADGRERLRLWGRLVTVWRETPEDEDARGPDTRAVAASGRRIGLAAVALAVIVPLALPSVRAHGLFGTSPAGGGTGGGAQVAGPQPLVVMHNQLLAHTAAPVLTYRTNALNPSQQYLQMYVLDYDGKSAWTLQGRTPSVSVLGQALPPAPGLAGSTDSELTRTAITLGAGSGGRDLSYLPAPYAPELVTGQGTGWQDTRSTLMLYGYRSDAGLHYTVTSTTADPTLAQEQAGGKLPASIKKSYLGYSGPDRAQLAKIAASIIRRTRTPFARALALQSYFTKAGRFTYALQGNLPGTVLQFLTTKRRGYCQQFAFSMAVLARLVGIPSRVAVGYTAGTEDASHAWQVTTADAHAWPELYFARTGWLRFEPTPGGPGGQGTATQPSYLFPARGGSGGQPPVIRGSTAPASKGAGGGKGSGPGGSRKPIAEDPGGGPAGNGSAAAGGFPVALVVLLVLLVLLAAPGLARPMSRRRRWRRAGDDANRAHAAWHELTSDLVDLGLGGPPSESPRALARRVAASAGLDEPARRALDQIAAAEERARYARAPVAGDSLQADVRVVRKALAGQVTGRQRWRARLMPASVLSPVAAGLREVADVFGWLDAAGMRIRRVLGSGPGRPGRPRRAD